MNKLSCAVLGLMVASCGGNPNDNRTQHDKTEASNSSHAPTAVGSQNMTTASSGSRPAEFNPEIMVEPLYDQSIGDTYGSQWFSGLIAATGDKRLVYVETNEKTVEAADVAFDCQDDMNIKYRTYDTENGTIAQETFIGTSQEWMQKETSDELDLDFSVQFPYDGFVLLKQKYCKH